jgi:L-threonylcarbamoyladenylate synthase
MDKDNELIKTLSSGGIAVIPTDTIYGVVGKALVRKTVERIYQVKERTPEKPFIILISDFKDLNLFNVTINDYQKRFLTKYWPGPISVALSCLEKKYEYLHRGTKFLAFRMPNDDELRKLVAKTGPLVAPSANPEGLDPSSNISMAKKYFGDEVDYYFDKGEVESPPSTLVLLNEDKYLVLREGGTKIKY